MESDFVVKSRLFLWKEITVPPHRFHPDIWVSGGNLPVRFHPLVGQNTLNSQVHFADIAVFCWRNSPRQCCLPVLPRGARWLRHLSTLGAGQAWRSLPTSQMADNLRRFPLSGTAFCHLSDFFFFLSPLCERWGFFFSSYLPSQLIPPRKLKHFQNLCACYDILLVLIENAVEI